MTKRFNIWTAIVFLALFPLVNVLTVALGDEVSSVTVVNRTGHYLHVYIDEQQYLYIPPERSVTHTSNPKASALVVAFYAPGQGITGSLTDTVTVPYRAAQEACTCAEGETWGDCVYSPPAGGSARLEILPEDLEAPK